LGRLVASPLIQIKGVGTVGGCLGMSSEVAAQQDAAPCRLPSYDGFAPLRMGDAARHWC